MPVVPDWQRAADAGHQRRTDSAGARPAGGALTTATFPRGLLEEIIAWSLEGRPNEACGLLAGSAPAPEGGTATRFLPLSNVAASPYRYLIDAEEQLRAMLDIDDADEDIWGIVHSHVASPAEPSDTDVGLAAYPDALYLICSLATPAPDVRAWSIRDGAVVEVTLEPV